jgi:hypothetical protein
MLQHALQGGVPLVGVVVPVPVAPGVVVVVVVVVAGAVGVVGVVGVVGAVGTVGIVGVGGTGICARTSATASPAARHTSTRLRVHMDPTSLNRRTVPLWKREEAGKRDSISLGEIFSLSEYVWPGLSVLTKPRKRRRTWAS